MKIIALAASALLLAAGGAVAGSDHYGSNWDYPQSRVDKSYTSSMKQPNQNIRKKTPATVYRPTTPNLGSDRSHWGNH